MTRSPQAQDCPTYPHFALRDAPVFNGCFLAGGAITSAYSNAPINDYDFYFKSKAFFCDAVRVAYSDGYWCASKTERALTFLDNSGAVLQFMLFSFFPTHDAIFECFDFRCCMGAIDCDTMKTHLHEHFMCDLVARRLVFNPKTQFPIASAARVRKYQDKGFTVSRGALLKIGAACASLKIDTWEELYSQLGGVYGEQILMAKDEGEFSWDAAFAAIDSAEFIKGEPTECPDNADDLLAQIFPVEEKAAS